MQESMHCEFLILASKVTLHLLNEHNNRPRLNDSIKVGGIWEGYSSYLMSLPELHPLYGFHLIRGCIDRA